MERFWKYVDQSCGTEACWPWKGYRWPSGYGRVIRKGRNIRTHRLAFMLARGPIPTGMHVLHHCDNPPCCNPAHLFLGTHDTNMADKKAKGRTAKGEGHGQARLSRGQVLAMREGYEQGRTQEQLAREFGISSGHASAIITRRRWASV